MKTKCLRFLFLLISVCLVMTSCRTEQALNATATPMPTNTSLPSITPTPTSTPQPSPALLLENNGFYESQSTTFCQQNPCTYYVKSSQSSQEVDAIIWDDGKFEIHMWGLEELGKSDLDDQLDLLQNIITPLYPSEVVSFVMDTTKTFLALPTAIIEKTESVSGYTVYVKWDRTNASLMRVHINQE